MAAEPIRNQTDDASGTPLFDERASARAQPVEPIHLVAEPVHQNAINVWHERIGAVASFLGTQTRALAVVVVVGLITGAVGGLLLVNAARNDQDSVVVETPSPDPAAELSTSETQNLDAFATELGANAQALRPAIKRIARGRSRSNRPRAYRVAIIRGR
jgi:hypothetical protein